MKKILTCIAIVIALLDVSHCFAQEQPQPDAPAAAMKQKLMTELKFSDIQANTVINIRQDFRHEFLRVRTDQSLSQQDKNAKLLDLETQRNLKIKSILSPAAYKQYQDWDARQWQTM
jgi:hypothetical protein